MHKDIKGRVAYLKGLAEGLQLDQDTKHGKVLTSVIEVLQDVAGELEGLRRSHDEVEAYVESLDEDLATVEDDLYVDDDEVVLVEDEDEDDEDLDDDDDEQSVLLEETDDEPVYFKVECPNCHENVYFEDSLLDDDYSLEVTCPNCGSVVYTTDEDFESADEVDEFTNVTAEAGSVPRRRLGRRGLEGRVGSNRGRTSTSTRDDITI